MKGSNIFLLTGCFVCIRINNLLKHNPVINNSDGGAVTHDEFKNRKLFLFIGRKLIPDILL